MTEALGPTSHKQGTLEMFQSRMMDFPLTLTHFLRRSSALFGSTEIVSRQADRSIHRCTYADVCRRSAQLAGALASLGARPGDRVATLAWNHHRHLELYLGVPCYGAVIHPLNVRLHPSELAYIAEHAGDRFLFVDRSLLPLFERFAATVPGLERVIVMDDGAPHPYPPGALDYEELLRQEPPHFDFPELDERAPSTISYTSGTTGRPKGVVYSHRSTVLHTLVSCTADGLAVSEADCVMPVVPMFHANAWGLPYTAFAAGSKLVFPGPHLDMESILELMAAERVTLSAAVPTIWLGVLSQLDREPGRWDVSAMRSIVTGGSAAPPAMIERFERAYGIQIVHEWGMTETNPIGTVSRVKRTLAASGETTRLSARSSQGYPVPLVEHRHAGPDGAILPWDGTTMGELEVRGPFVASSYAGGEGADSFTGDGWFRTGDVVTIDPEGYMRIVDRNKDVIRSGGESISSVALENALMSHPAVLEAAVFAARDPRWSERPLAAIVLKEGRTATPEDLRAHIEADFARFWLPDAYLFLDQIPKTSTGKFLKSKLRADHGEHLVANRREIGVR